MHLRRSHALLRNASPAAAAASSNRQRRFHIGLRRAAGSVEKLRAQQDDLRPQRVQPLGLRTPVFQVFGSNTDIGKTLVSAGIVRSAVERVAGRVGYIKPLQTGTDDADAGGFQGDAAFVQRHALQSTSAGAGASATLDCSTLFSWKTPVSPHLAAALEGHTITDDALVALLTAKLQQVNAAEDPYSLVLVETAGGVCSPSASMRFQADVYRGLRLPVVLVGDGKLGGISSTMSALESLLLRGYDVAALCLIEQEQLGNAEALAPRLSELGIPMFMLQPVPPQPEPLDAWFAAQSGVFAQVNAVLQRFHADRVARFEHVHARAEQVFWWPFTQHKAFGALSVIDSAHGDDFSVLERESSTLAPMFDACASWWTQGIGHGNAKMATALAYAAGRYGHVMFPENAHEPALQLSERLLETVGAPWASRVYFSDDGSTAVEVGLKMAFRKFVTDHGLAYSELTTTTTTADTASGAQPQPHKKLVVLAQANCYHGDTLGVMNVAEPSVYNAKQHPWYRPEGVFLQTPSLALRDGEVVVTLDAALGGGESTGERFACMDDAFDLPRRSARVTALYRAYAARAIDAAEQDAAVRVGALLIEPVLVGAGGMVLVDPLFQRALVDECRARRIPVIFDEVFSGWWRLGVQAGRDLLGVDPDIACYAKLLTGGVVPLAVTLAREDVFDTFFADAKGDALLHGHSFTAHPIGCAAALTALDMYAVFTADDAPVAGGLRTRVYWDAERVKVLSTLPGIARAFAIGTVVAVELATANAGYASGVAQELIRALRRDGVYARALGNVVYMMCSPLTSTTDCARHLAQLQQLVTQHSE
ncbi:hypothetical protein PybrP1_010962 [[Pythium] brassicae (nom. inval.)]|nr:hypothetical protein PybrP1_010962 [[Pythium] brassicae (nom. inval.)]